MDMGQGLSDGQSCRIISNANVDSIAGAYYGETIQDLPHGKGVFVSLDKKILIQRFEKGSSQTSGRYLELDLKTKELVLGHRTKGKSGLTEEKSKFHIG